MTVVLVVSLIPTSRKVIWLPRGDRIQENYNQYAMNFEGSEKQESFHGSGQSLTSNKLLQELDNLSSRISRQALTLDFTHSQASSSLAPPQRDSFHHCRDYRSKDNRKDRGTVFAELNDRSSPLGAWFAIQRECCESAYFRDQYLLPPWGTWSEYSRI